MTITIKQLEDTLDFFEGTYRKLEDTIVEKGPKKSYWIPFMPTRRKYFYYYLSVVEQVAVFSDTEKLRDRVGRCAEKIKDTVDSNKIYFMTPTELRNVISILRRYTNKGSPFK